MEFLFSFFIINRIYMKFIDYFFLKNSTIFLLLNNMYCKYYFNILKQSMIYQMKTLSDLTIIHDLDNKLEYELIYVTLSYTLNIRIFSILFCNKDDLIFSMNNIYPNANWLEREIWDLFGIKFIYHKDLRRILTDYGFIGHPLLKFYPLMGFMELRYDDSLNKIIQDVLELSQAYRFYTYINPWWKWYN